MLTGHSLVYFAPGKWDGLWRNRHQLMSVFARQNKVIYVERRHHLRPTLAGFRRGDLGLSDLRRSSLRQISDNLYVYCYPVWAPTSGRFPLKEVTGAIRRSSIQSALRALGMSRPIVWFSHPHMVDLIGEIPSASLRLYHAVDEYGAYSGVTPDRRRKIGEHETEMMAQVDAVIVVSQKLYEAKCPYNPHTYLIPNGVDYQAYSAALVDPYAPDDLHKIPAPRLGYSGLVGDRLNLRMLSELAHDNPQWSLVFLGEARVSQQAEIWQELLTLPNVYHLGQVDVSQVPHYLKGFQIGLMPYVQSRESENISPLKLYDYLAAGLPIAAIDIPAARDFGQYIHISDSPEAFSGAVQAALADTTPERRHQRREIAARHTWEARVEELSGLIQAQLAVEPAT